MNVLVVTPTYNERENLPLLAAGVLAHDGFRLLVVDDGSPDGTGAVADQLVKDHPGRVEVLHRTGPRGLGRSYIDGLLRAIQEGRAEFVCQMDCDLSHDPAYLPSLVTAAAANELVIGSRYMN
ncbi:MAG TPA: glycosyltransferase, partial [Vicinamibacterales bacterium]